MGDVCYSRLAKYKGKRNYVFFTPINYQLANYCRFWDKLDLFLQICTSFFCWLGCREDFVWKFYAVCKDNLKYRAISI